MSSVGGKKRQMYVYIIFEWPLSAILKGVKYHTCMYNLNLNTFTMYLLTISYVFTIYV